MRLICNNGSLDPQSSTYAQAVQDPCEFDSWQAEVTREADDADKRHNEAIARTQSTLDAILARSWDAYREAVHTQAAHAQAEREIMPGFALSFDTRLD